ncbi:MAG: hypothetical protein VKJ64_06545 [Leptolyngbyaceae bacterium]|nr:hypothetical protein [Leptolyngbyaceae bacterium]
MTVANHPSLQAKLDEAIATYNPFEGHFVVKTKDLWSDDFFDVPSINNYVSDHILEQLQKINNPSINLNTHGIVIKAGKGRGKTHILSRIAHRLRNEGNGAFIYVCEYGDLSNIRYQFLQALTTSLKKPGKSGLSLWQELAIKLVNSVLKNQLSVEKVVKGFPSILLNKPEQRERFISQIHAKHKAVIHNPYITRAILWTISPIYAPYSINWLSGRGLTEKQAQIMDLPDVDKEDQEKTAFDISCQILNLLGQYCTPVICFDQLDGVEFGSEDDLNVSGFSRGMVVASLATDLYDNIDRGVFITSLYEGTWEQEIIGSITAVEDRIGQTKLELQPLSPDTAVDLVHQILKTFYSNFDKLTLPNPFYPFEEKEIREKGREKPTVRELMRWYADKWSKVGTVIPPLEKIKKVYNSILENIDDDFFESNEQIANALAFSFKYLVGQTIGTMTVNKIERDVKPKAANSGWINFIIHGVDDGKPAKIGVAVLQNKNGRGITAGLTRLTDYQKFKLTRGCLVRSQAINTGARKGLELKDQLLTKQSGEWVSPKIDEIRSLLALQELSRTLDDEGFTQADFEQFIAEEKLLVEHPVLTEILSDPSGQSPDELTDEDADLDQAMAEQLNLTDAEDDDLELAS